MQYLVATSVDWPPVSRSGLSNTYHGLSFKTTNMNIIVGLDKKPCRIINSFRYSDPENKMNFHPQFAEIVPNHCGGQADSLRVTAFCSL